MEHNDILIECDEVTKNIMEELADEMAGSLSRISKELQKDISLSIRPIEKKLNDLKEDLIDENEEIIEKIEDINKSISKMTLSIEDVLNECINNVMLKEDNILNERINKLIKDTSLLLQGVKVNNDNTIAVNSKIDELKKSVEGNFFDNKMLLHDKMNNIKSVIDEKNMLMETISNYEKEHDKKLKSIMEELEYSNKSFFYKLFNRRKYGDE